jgi:lipopolysaccharide transport system permease protein
MQDGPWTRVIRPSHSWFEIPWREVWQYRDLIWNLASRDVAVSYKQTILGPFWFIIQPLMVTVVFSFLFGEWPVSNRTISLTTSSIWADSCLGVFC